MQRGLDASTLDGPVIREISPRDGMFAGKEDHYFSVGRSALRAILLALLAADNADPSRVLDFACGYGRVTRWLRASFPEAAIWACDVDPGAVEFSARTFRATPIEASARPADTPLPGDLDLVWCGSLLTHLDQDAWAPLLHALSRSLRIGGLLVFTTHGRRAVSRMLSGDTYGLGEPERLDLLVFCRSSGFGFGRYPNSPSYGISVSLPRWVVTTIEQIPDLRLLLYEEAGWDDHQDVIAVRRMSRSE